MPGAVDADRTPAVGGDADGTERRILFIDDDESVLRLLSKYFAKLGYQTYTAVSGREGIRAFHRTRPDVTVVDLHMPDITGFNVLEELRPKRPMLIMLTADGAVEQAVEAMRGGAETFLTKPVKLSHLEVAVDKAAEKAALYRENTILRSRITPSSKRMIARATLVSMLIAVSGILGSLIGASPDGPRSGPIRVPINPNDTIVTTEVGPFRAFPDPTRASGPAHVKTRSRSGAAR